MDTHTDAIIHRVSRPAPLAASLAAAALLLAVLPATADASTYTVTACNDAPGAANNSWVPFDTNTTHLQTRLSCPYTINEGQQASQENGIATTDILELPNGAQAGAQAGWTFAASPPPATTITGISYDRMFSTQDQSTGYPPSAPTAQSCPGKPANRPVAGSCLTGSGPGGPNHATITGLTAETLTLGLWNAPRPPAKNASPAPTASTPRSPRCTTHRSHNRRQHPTHTPTHQPDPYGNPAHTAASTRAPKASPSQRKMSAEAYRASS